MRLKSLAVFLLFTVGAFAQAQAATHSVTLSFTDASNPAGTTYNVYRATGLCSGTPSFSKLASAITVKTYTDSTVTPGNFCYQATATVQNLESAPSNTVNPAVLPFSIQISATVQ